MRRAASEDKKRVIDILTRAFDTNQSVNYVVRQGKGREQRLIGLMDYSFNVCQRFGEVWISDDGQACALLLFPGNKRVSVSSLWLDIRMGLSVIGLNRVRKVLIREGMIKRFHPREPICYLWFIGVHPKMQGKGIGSALIREVIQECDKKGRSIYLETSVDSNLPWYKRFGFEIFHSLNLTYKLYLLRRKVSVGQSVPAVPLR